jgi:hypothetical protein
MSSTEYETLRWPTNLDRAGIELRLVQVRDYALANGLPEIAAYFENVPRLGSAQLGAVVLTALNSLQKSPEHRQIVTQLEMVAMNLKNLK